MALNVSIKTKKRNRYEAQVIIALSGLVYSDDIEGAQRAFLYDLNKMPRQSVGSPSDFYNTKITKERTLEVWHLNAKGDQDRLVAVVSEKPTANE